MRLTEEFTIDETADVVWKFFEQAEVIAACVPGFESIEVLDEDNVVVRMSQRVGPMSATFEANVKVTERQEKSLIRFEAVGKSVRGAAGHVRVDNTVRLRDVGDGTVVTVDGDVVLAGALGSVGQKVVAKQAGRVMAEFVGNLRRLIAGEPPQPTAGRATGGRPAPIGRTVASPLPSARSTGELESLQRMLRICAALSAASLLASLLVLLRNRRSAR